MEQEVICQIQNHTGDVDLLARLNTRLAAHYDYEKNMNTALEMIGEHLHYDRVHIIEVRHDMSVAILYEWHNRELAFVDYNVKSKEVLCDTKLVEQLYQYNYITINEADETVNPEIRMQLAYQNGKRMILLPLIEFGAQFAFIAFIQCTQVHDWAEEEIRMMESVRSVVATSLQKNKMIDKLYHHLVLLKRSEQEALSLRTQLSHLNEELQPVWRQMKDYLKQTETDKPEVQAETLDRQIYTLDRICRMGAIK